MSDHDPDRDTRIRQRAYFLWLAEGRPEGRAAEHWRQASEAEASASDQIVDEESEESFPASDPPSHSGITGVVGRG